MFVINWLNTNSGSVMALLTAVYVVATIWIVLESRRTNKLQTQAIQQAAQLEQDRNRRHVLFSIRPELRASSDIHAEFFFIAEVRNSGVTSAHALNISLNPHIRARFSIDKSDESAYRSPTLLSNPISVLHPNEALSEVVGPSKFLFEDHSDEELHFKVSASYADVLGREYRECFELDLAAQKERITPDDTEGKQRYRFISQFERAVQTLEHLGRIVDTLDRSSPHHPAAPLPLAPVHEELLTSLLEASEQDLSAEFLLR